MKRSPFVLALMLSLAACGDDAADPVEPGGPPAPSAGTGGGVIGIGSDDPNGQTGSMGPRECDDDEECVSSRSYQLATYLVASPQQTAFASARCEWLGVMGDQGSVSGPGCMCELQGGGSRWVGPRGVDCNALSRTGDCLWAGEDFAGCTIGDAETCEATCDELATRLDADAQRALEGELRYAACTEGGSCESVVEIESRCFANGSYMTGKAYDCALSPQQILAQYRDDQEPNQGDLLPPSQTNYVEGRNGFVELAAGQSFSAGEPAGAYFGGFAQFFDVEGMDGSFGEVIDPLEGIDDCGVVKRGNTGVAASVEYTQIGMLELIDGDRRHAFELSSASNQWFSSYILELAEAGVGPRYGGRYGLRGGGGPFGEDFALDDFRLPQALAIPELERSARVARGALELTWTGRGEAPLRIALSVVKTLSDVFEPYAIECLVKDDGAFTIPAAVLEAAPEGFVAADFTRERRALVKAGAKQVAAIARVAVNHNFVLGERCDRADVMAACLKYAEHVQQAYAECATVPPPPLAQLCPAYLAEACTGCTEVFECRTENTFCTPNGLQVNSFCACD